MVSVVGQALVTSAARPLTLVFTSGPCIVSLITLLYQSLPQLLARVVFQGTQIVGKAFAEAGRQAWRSEFFALQPSSFPASPF